MLSPFPSRRRSTEWIAPIRVRELWPPFRRTGRALQSRSPSAPRSPAAPLASGTFARRAWALPGDSSPEGRRAAGRRPTRRQRSPARPGNCSGNRQGHEARCLLRCTWNELARPGSTPARPSGGVGKKGRRRSGKRRRSRDSRTGRYHRAYPWVCTGGPECLATDDHRSMI